MKDFEGDDIDYYESIYGELPLGFDKKGIYKIIKEYYHLLTWKDRSQLAKDLLRFYSYDDINSNSEDTYYFPESTEHYRKEHLQLIDVLQDTGTDNDYAKIRLFNKCVSVILYELINYVKESEMSKKLASNLMYNNFGIDERIDILKLSLSFKNYGPRNAILQFIYFETYDNARSIRDYYCYRYAKLYEDSVIVKEIEYLTKLAIENKEVNRIYNAVKSGYKKVKPSVSKTYDLNISIEKLSIFYKALIKDSKVNDSYSKESDFIAVFSGQEIPEDYQKIHWTSKVELATFIGECVESLNKWKKAKELFTVPSKVEDLAKAYNKGQHTSAHSTRMAYFDSYLQ